jgi:hypothetical protein
VLTIVNKIKITHRTILIIFSKAMPEPESIKLFLKAKKEKGIQPKRTTKKW